MTIEINVQNVDSIEKFMIDTPLKADWAIEKIKEERSRRDLFVSVAKNKIALLEAQIQGAESNCDNETSFLLFALSDYLQGEKTAKETKTQRSISLPSGKIVCKLEKLDFEKDDKKLLLYLQEYAKDFVKVESAPMWGEFKKDLLIQGDIVIRKSTGEVLDCISIVKKPSTVEVV